MRVLVVEDETDSAAWICGTLDGAGFESRRVRAAAALSELNSHRPDAVVIDLTMPGPSGQGGFTFIETARAAGVRVPTLILSALGHADERVRGRRAGADVFLTKPIAAVELVVRLKDLVRGAGGVATVQTLRCADLSLDLATGRVERAGRVLELKPGELRLLEQLLRNKDQVVTRRMLLETAWNYRFDPHSSLVDTHVSRLRRKIDDGFPIPLLHTRRGVGYKLSETP